MVRKVLNEQVWYLWYQGLCQVLCILTITNKWYWVYYTCLLFRPIWQYKHMWLLVMHITEILFIHILYNAINVLKDILWRYSLTWTMGLLGSQLQSKHYKHLLLKFGNCDNNFVCNYGEEDETQPRGLLILIMLFLIFINYNNILFPEFFILSLLIWILNFLICFKVVFFKY